MFNFSDSPITLFLILVNVMASLYALFFDHSLIERYSFRPAKILREREYDRLLTAGFIHVSLGHLFFNMFTLFFFGPVLEGILGIWRFIVLYFGSELAAHGLALYMHRKSTSYSAVGASGAVSGIVFAFCLWLPFEKIYIFLIPIGIPAILFAFLYVAGSIYAMKVGREQGASGGIAHEAHVGGALGGLLLTMLLQPFVIPHFIHQLQLVF